MTHPDLTPDALSRLTAEPGAAADPDPASTVVQSAPLPPEPAAPTGWKAKVRAAARPVANPILERITAAVVARTPAVAGPPVDATDDLTAEIVLLRAEVGALRALVLEREADAD